MDFELQREQYRLSCEQSLHQWADSLFEVNSKISEAARYSLLGGGKRVRGILVLAVCDLLSGNREAAMAYAAAVEMIHAFSLIHDDLPCMDDDDLRRGNPATHIAYGQASALLAGDMLSIQAFETIAGASASAESRLKAVQTLAYAAGSRGMIYGQELDLHYEQIEANETELHKIHQFKTGALILAAIRLGCCTANVSSEQQAALEFYAEQIGMVFQIVDDLLDNTSCEAVLGKPIGSDIKKGKTTFVTLFGEQKAREKAQEYTTMAQAKIQSVFGDKSNFLNNFSDNLLKRLS